LICGHFARPFVDHSYGYARLSASQTASQLTRHAFMPYWIVWVECYTMVRLFGEDGAINTTDLT